MIQHWMARLRCYAGGSVPRKQAPPLLFPQSCSSRSNELLGPNRCTSGIMLESGHGASGLEFLSQCDDLLLQSLVLL
jgi:hypothetical protein